MSSAFVTVAALASRRRPTAGEANIGSRSRRSRRAPARTILKPARAAGVLITVLVVQAPAAGAWAAPPGAAADARLLLRFVEDGAVVRNAWLEGALSWEDVAGGGDVRFRPNVAFRYGRDVEAGFVMSLLHRSREAGSFLHGSVVQEDQSSTGLGDLVLYGKYRVLRSPVELSLGATCTVPLAHADSGLTSGAVQGSGFVGLRRRWSALTIAGHVGLARSEAARSGDGAEGRLSGTAGIGVLFPLAPMWVLVAELDHAGPEFEGDGSVSRLLVGLDWRPLANMVVRGGVGAGLSDAAPDATGLASLVFDL
jgi:hypothetical protein